MWFLIIVIFACSVLGALRYQEHFVQPKLNLVLVTSVIHTVSSPLRFAYGDNKEHSRSLFTHEERLDQTIKTVESIKKKIPNACIVLLEGSVLTDEEQHKLFDVGCDHMYNVHDDLENVINSPYKSFAEVNMMLHFLNSQWFLDNRNNFETFSKMSGRYQLTDNFHFDKYPITSVVAQCADRCNTRYYRIPINMMDEFVDILKSALKDPDFASYQSEIEDFNIYKRFRDQSRVVIVKKPELLGVGGLIAPYKRVIEDFVI